jgi:excisionase family DNA binding protein
MDARQRRSSLGASVVATDTPAALLRAEGETVRLQAAAGEAGHPADPSRAESEMIMERLLLSPEQVAESLGVCRSRVYELMRTRALPSVKIGRARRVPVSAVRAYVDQLTDSWDLS